MANHMKKKMEHELGITISGSGLGFRFWGLFLGFSFRVWTLFGNAVMAKSVPEAAVALEDMAMQPGEASEEGPIP